MSQTDHDVKVLNDLIETTIDSANGYREAARDADNTRFAGTFSSRAQERSQVTGQLQRQVRMLGAEPEDDGSVLARAHRVFVNLRKSLSSGDTAVVDEVERGEDHIKAKFEDALKDDALSPPTRSVIMQAYVSVKTGHDQMRDLKQSLHRQH
jgi:uncharacterized protein (TIGR02284 family)